MKITDRRSKHTRFALSALLIIALGVSFGYGQELVKLPYVPTPQGVVDEMLAMAVIKESDFLIDLGSGDGRIVITAAKRFKARGMGVDIDPELIALSNATAKSEKVDDLVQFVEQDMFKADISKATLLTLYVLPEFMRKLRPKLLAELKPGARIVAHDYPLEDWSPDRAATLTVPEKVAANGTDKAYLYLWIVPAAVEGTWRIEIEGEKASDPLVVTLTQRYQVVSARAERQRRPVEIGKPSLSGDLISFSINLDKAQYQLRGRVQGDKMEGSASAPNLKRALNWRAARIK